MRVGPIRGDLYNVGVALQECLRLCIIDLLHAKLRLEATPCQMAKPRQVCYIERRDVCLLEGQHRNTAVGCQYPHIARPEVQAPLRPYVLVETREQIERDPTGQHNQRRLVVPGVGGSQEMPGTLKKVWPARGAYLLLGIRGRLAEHALQPLQEVALRGESALQRAVWEPAGSLHERCLQ